LQKTAHLYSATAQKLFGGTEERKDWLRKINKSKITN